MKNEIQHFVKISLLKAFPYSKSFPYTTYNSRWVFVYNVPLGVHHDVCTLHIESSVYLCFYEHNASSFLVFFAKIYLVSKIAITA